MGIHLDFSSVKNSMFRFGVFGVRSMSSAVKRTTGIVGLPVAERAQETLVGLYTQTLEALEAIPPSSQYRVNVEKMTQVRLDAVRASLSAAELESSVKAGQVEEMIEAAKDELVLIEKLQQSKPWDTSKPAKVDASIL